MKPQLRFLFAGGAIAALSALVTYAIAGPPAGSPVQRTITYEGNLTDTQGALQATYPMQFSLWDSESGQQGKLWESNSTNMPVEQTTGRFIAVLGPAIGPELPDNVYETPSLWLGATIDAIPMPRQRIAAVPFAVRAEKASVADAAVGFAGTSNACPAGKCSSADYVSVSGPVVEVSSPNTLYSSTAVCPQTHPIPVVANCNVDQHDFAERLQLYEVQGEFWDKPEQWDSTDETKRARYKCTFSDPDTSGVTGKIRASIVCMRR